MFYFIVSKVENYALAEHVLYLTLNKRAAIDTLYYDV